MVSLVKTIPQHWCGPIRYFADGKPISAARYLEIMQTGQASCFSTESVSIRGGFPAHRHRCEVSVA